ncbi:hypothetical protein Nmel_007613 [Mimus melanotis]
MNLRTRSQNGRASPWLLLLLIVNTCYGGEHGKKLLRAIHSELLQRSDSALEAFGNVIKMDHLSGEGAWAQAKYQAKALNQVILEKNKGSGREGFQLPTNLLKTQIEKQAEDPSLHPALLLELTKANANPIWIPLNPPPTLTDIIEACAKRAAVVRPENKKQPFVDRTVTAAAPDIPPLVIC